MISIIDLFAGLGGFSEGAKRAGHRVVWAANHNRAACETHARNHPDTVHACQDLQQASFHDLPPHDAFAASPACQGHSRARGLERPHHDAMRSTAWAVVTCAEVHRQKIGVVENVPEFLSWALYPAWCAAMQALGYSLAPHLIDAADHGVPQHRRRVFIICTRSASPLWLKLPKHDYVPASTVLTDAGTWSSVRSKCVRTRARVSAGRRAHGNRFLVAYYGNEKGGRSIHRPIGTITTHDRYALVEGGWMKMITASECRAFMGFSADYKLPASSTAAKFMLGNAVCPDVAADIFRAIEANA
jgi:DNA (cytosine-5)-methyltransferase 1